MRSAAGNYSIACCCVKGLQRSSRVRSQSRASPCRCLFGRPALNRNGVTCRNDVATTTSCHDFRDVLKFEYDPTDVTSWPWAHVEGCTACTDQALTHAHSHQLPPYAL